MRDAVVVLERERAKLAEQEKLLTAKLDGLELALRLIREECEPETLLPQAGEPLYGREPEG